MLLPRGLAAATVSAIPFLQHSVVRSISAPSSSSIIVMSAILNSGSSSKNGGSAAHPARHHQMHDEALVRPETAGVPKSSTSSSSSTASGDLVFFNTFFCPYAQMTWIAINEKGIAERTEFVEGLKIVGGDYDVHPRLRALGRSGVPTLHNPQTGDVVDGSTDCVAYVDENFGAPHQLLPKDPRERVRAKRTEELLHSTFTFPFYSMLLRQEPEEQETAKRKLRAAIRRLAHDYRGPYYMGAQFTVADIAVAPYFDRMVVLEHYRDFKVADDEDGDAAHKWVEWSRHVLERPSVAATRQDRDRILEAYRRYAHCYVRNNWYHRVFVDGR